MGDVVIVLKQTQHWYYGHLKSCNRIKQAADRGIFPKSHVQILESVKIKNDYVIRRSEIVDEITRVLYEWRELFKNFYLVIIWSLVFLLVEINWVWAIADFSQTTRAFIQYVRRCAT